MTESQSIIRRMSPLELSMLLERGMTLPAELDAKARLYREMLQNDFQEPYVHIPLPHKRRKRDRKKAEAI